MAVEAVVLTASKKDKASGMLSLGLDVLKKLYNSTNKKIKVRALVVSVFKFPLKYSNIILAIYCKGFV